MRGFSNDVRHALRLWLKTPSLSIAAFVSLALAIGANTSVFSILQTVVLRSLPYPGADRMVAVYETKPARGWDRLTVSRLNLEDFRAGTRSFERFTASRTMAYTITGGGEAQNINVGQVDAEYLPWLSAQPALGRLFTSEEVQPGKDRVAVITHRLWQSRFHGDPGAVGGGLMMDNKQFTVIGVLPASFEFIYERETDAFIPITNDPDMNLPRTHRNLVVYATLKPGVRLAQAQSDISGVTAQIERADANMRGCGAQIVPLMEDVVGSARTTLWVLQGAVAFVLLIACANIANLLLARAASRQQELAVRLALGASRWRLLRQSLAESSILAVAGGGAGWLLAHWGVDVAKALNPGNLPRISEVRLDGGTLAATAGFALIAAIVCGALPAIRASGGSIRDAMGGGQRLSSGGLRVRWTRNVLVVTELGLAVALLAGAGLMIDSFRRLSHVNLGFRTENCVTGWLLYPSERYPRPLLQSRMRQLIDNLEAVPGVRSAALGSTIPLAGGGDGTQSFVIEGRPPADPNVGPVAAWRNITPGYFRTFGIPIVRGRDFTRRDDERATPVAIVSEALVRRYLSGEDPIGKRIQWGRARSVMEIVGVAADARFDGPRSRPQPEVYFAFDQNPRWGPYVAVTGSLSDSELLRVLHRAVAELDPDQPLSRPRSMTERLGRQVAQPRWNAVVLGAFAGIALALALVGVFGVMHYLVSLRTREFGIRMALGARVPDVYRLVLGEGMRLAVAGVAAGVAAALLLSRFLKTQLFETQPNDPVVLGGVAALVLATGLIALAIPAARATAVDPTVALREE